MIPHYWKVDHTKRKTDGSSKIRLTFYLYTSRYTKHENNEMKIASRTNCVNQSMMDDIDGYHHWRYGPLLLGCNLIITYRPSHFCLNNANSRWK